MKLSDVKTLSNGIKIPSLGLGMWFIKGKAVETSFINAIKLGYRHFDTAVAYGNEIELGKAIKNTSIKREELFITSKIPAEVKTYIEARKCIDEILEKLDLEYLDLLLIHSPQPWVDVNQSDNRYKKENIEVWKAMEEAYSEGKLRSIGVSNFLIGDLENLIANCSIPPMVDQILCHIGNTPSDLIDFCFSHKILPEAYSPLGHGEVFKMEAIRPMLDKYGVTIPRLCLAYLLQMGLIVIPKASSYEHLKENCDLDFQIEEEDIEKLKNIDRIKDYGEFSSFPVFGGKRPR